MWHCSSFLICKKLKKKRKLNPLDDIKNIILKLNSPTPWAVCTLELITKVAASISSLNIDNMQKKVSNTYTRSTRAQKPLTARRKPHPPHPPQLPESFHHQYAVGWHFLNYSSTSSVCVVYYKTSINLCMENLNSNLP